MSPSYADDTKTVDLLTLNVDILTLNEEILALNVELTTVVNFLIKI